MKAKHALIHDTFTLERRYPSARAKVAGEHPGAAANARDRTCKTPRSGEVSEAIRGPP
jgi:hypothetical protein